MRHGLIGDLRAVLEFLGHLSMRPDWIALGASLPGVRHDGDGGLGQSEEAQHSSHTATASTQLHVLCG